MAVYFSEREALYTSSMSLSRSSRVQSSPARRRNSAAPRIPFKYQPTCLRASRMARPSVLYSHIMEICLRIVRSRWERGGGGIIRLRSRIWALISLNTQGFPRAARPTITRSQPVPESIRPAERGSVTSPLPITGRDTASLTAFIMDQSAAPE